MYYFEDEMLDDVIQNEKTAYEEAKEIDDEQRHRDLTGYGY